MIILGEFIYPCLETVTLGNRNVKYNFYVFLFERRTLFHKSLAYHQLKSNDWEIAAKKSN